MALQVAPEASLTHTLDVTGSRLFRPQQRSRRAALGVVRWGEGSEGCPASSRSLLTGVLAAERGSQRWRKHSMGNR